MTFIVHFDWFYILLYFTFNDFTIIFTGSMTYIPIYLLLFVELVNAERWLRVFHKIPQEWISLPVD